MPSYRFRFISFYLHLVVEFRIVRENNRELLFIYDITKERIFFRLIGELSNSNEDTALIINCEIFKIYSVSQVIAEAQYHTYILTPFWKLSDLFISDPRNLLEEIRHLMSSTTSMDELSKKLTRKEILYNYRMKNIDLTRLRETSEEITDDQEDAAFERTNETTQEQLEITSALDNASIAAQLSDSTVNDTVTELESAHDNPAEATAGERELHVDWRPLIDTASGSSAITIATATTEHSQVSKPTGTSEDHERVRTRSSQRLASKRGKI